MPQAETDLLHARIKELERLEDERRRLQEDHLWIAQIVASAEDAIISRRTDGIIRSANRGTELVYGYTPSELIGQPMTLLLPPDRVAEEEEIMRRVARGERVEHLQTVRMRKDGRPIDVSLTISPLRDSEGKIVGASHVARDVTEQVEHERALGHLAAIVESSDDAIIGKDLKGIIQSWNFGAEQVYGYSAQEVIGRSMILLLPPDRPDEENEILARIGRGERVDHFETTRLRKDGGIITVSVTISPIRNRRGEVTGASHVARDVTGRSQLETARAQLAAIVESSDDAMISKNLDGVILTWNAGAERIYGYTPEEAHFRNMDFLLPPDRAGEEASILERLRRGERVDHFETVRVRKDGRRIDVSLTISPIRDELGVIRGASHVARDITERKHFETQLRQTAKLESLGVLAGGIAHDFNNLLTGILGNASLMLDSLAPVNANHKPMQEIVSAAERAADLTRQLLAYAGKGRFVTGPVNISELIREIAALVQTSVPRNVQLRLELGDVPNIEGDAGQIQQVVMNLVINAAEAIGTEKTGSVIVTSAVQDVDERYLQTVFGSEEIAPGRYVVMEVHDNGCGMDAATMARIFDPFFTTKFAGRGLGLAAVTGIVRGHKGALKVYSTPGQGTSFKVIFPAVATVSERPRVTEPRHDLRGEETVLVVDDEQVVRETARNALERYGYRVILARDGGEAVDIFRRRAEEIAMIVLDLTMPIMGGEDALREFKLVRPDVRVLLSSGFNEVEAVRRFTGKGLAGFIQKPYSALTFLERVRSVLDRRPQTIG